ncbi:MAG TPA: hypothetical protein VH796_13320 [Nitrososphaeraceae archaeon]|jgi:hypothetical protein
MGSNLGSYVNIHVLIPTIVLTLTLVLVTPPSNIGQMKQQTAFALDTLCPPDHECHCTPASGVYHDYDPNTGQTFNINNGCTDDTGR